VTLVRLWEPFRDEPVEWSSVHGSLAEKHAFCSSVEEHHAPLIHRDDGIIADPMIAPPAEFQPFSARLRSPTSRS
jgi:hypothetical protein